MANKSSFSALSSYGKYVNLITGFRVHKRQHDHIARIKPGGRKNNIFDNDKLKNREIVLYRARNEVRRLINANVNRYSDEMNNLLKPVFLTLTFAENIKDLTAANREFRKFMKRLGHFVAKDQAHVQYVAVPEFQKRGAVHYHLVIFNLPSIKDRT